MLRPLVLTLALTVCTIPVVCAQNPNLPPVPRGGFALPNGNTGVRTPFAPASTQNGNTGVQTPFAGGSTQAATQGFTAGDGDPGTQNLPTWGNFYGPSMPTGKNSMSVLPTTTSMPFPGTYTAPGNFANRQMGMVDLPITNLDSFVAQSGYDEDIYGDEGTYEEPPLFGFEENNEIEAGIHADAGTLTTNHRGFLPSAWGWTWRP